MKRQHSIIFVTCSLIAATALTMGGCKQVPKTIDDNDTIVAQESIDEIDTIVTQTIVINDGNNNDSTHFIVEFPQRTTPLLQNAIVEAINELLGGTYEGSYDQPEQLVRHYADLQKAELDEMAKEFPTDPSMPLEYSTTIRKTYETDKFVTYEMVVYGYTGGAHGFSIVTGITLRKSDGRHMGRELLLQQGGTKSWYEIIRDGLKDYFEVKTDEELADMLMDADAYMIPLPQSEPYFTDKGLLFIYQQYEIASYAAGMPCVVVPYSELPGVLNATGRKLIK